jgi:NACHT domain
MNRTARCATSVVAARYVADMNETGASFEARALALARAIHDPLGLQGSTMILGQERDGVFVSDDAIHVFEFTTRRDKAKALADGKKLADLLDHLGSDPLNRLKTRTGWFVTAEEPTADQADAVRGVAKLRSTTLHAVSFSTLRRRICDVEGYIAARDSAPFGGAVYAGLGKTAAVEPTFIVDSATQTVGDLAADLSLGKRRVLLGDFGVGKSFAAELLYHFLRKKYFKNPATSPFPIHINLRDCAGLRTPSEILRRHAEEIGFVGERGLMSAWRSGSCILILDGFDEIIPNRLVGAATNLRQVRWEALSPIRRLVAESPESSGVVVTGRSNYFSAPSEMLQTLGLDAAEVLQLEDFTESQVAEFLSGAKIVDAPIPDWLPTRPLFLASLASSNFLTELASIGSAPSAVDGWRQLVRMICEREAKIYSTVPPETIRALLAQLAVLSKVREAERGELGLEDMKSAFTQVSGRQTDEEALQLLLRLPGLAVAQLGSEESRVFSDKALAAATFGESLADYLSSPYQGHVLCEPAAWSSASEELSVDVAAVALRDVGMAPGQIAAACDYRFGRGHYDAILFDGIRVADALNAKTGDSAYIVTDIVVERIDIPAVDCMLSRTQIRGSIVTELDLSQVDDQAGCPTFDQCLIGHVSGVSAIPSALRGNFRDTEIDSFDDETSTTQGLLALEGLPMNHRVALSILNKVYAKRGAGRKDSALRRGLPASDWGYVEPAAASLLSAGLLHANSHGNVTVYLPVRSRRAEVLGLLEAPTAKAAASMFGTVA